MILLFVTIIVSIMAIRALLMVIGFYKDPVLASLEKYGNEQVYSPMFSLVIWGILLFYVLLFWYLNTGMMVALGTVIMIPLASFKEGFENFLEEHPNFFRSFPRWYCELVKRTDRQERRRIAYMWLYLPTRTRMLYNAHPSLFNQWVEQVILTISR
jgi:hypothetical protein